MLEIGTYNTASDEDIVCVWVKDKSEVVQRFAEFIEEVFGVDSCQALTMAQDAFTAGRVDMQVYGLI